VHVVLNIRGSLRHRVAGDARILLWTEAPRFGGRQEHPPLRGGTLELDGPAVAILSVGGR
jgi:maltooligosyltrehalose trehalohydrolase